MPKIKLVLAYVGTHYCGWQTQARKNGKFLPTIQSLIETQVSRIAETPVHVHGAGRTDSGVHADAQVAHMVIPDNKTHIDWQLALNTSLPADVRVVKASLASDSFHAQFSAVRKEYVYRLWLSRRYTPPRLYPFVWACGPVCVDKMDEAAQYLVGTQDFASLKNAGTPMNTTVRTVYAITRTPSGTLPCIEKSPNLVGGDMELAWTFEADGFLKQMVRNTMGLLVSVGLGKLSPEAVPALLNAHDRRHQGITAPARGLTLKKVYYEENI